MERGDHVQFQGTLPQCFRVSEDNHEMLQSGNEAPGQDSNLGSPKYISGIAVTTPQYLIYCHFTI